MKTFCAALFAVSVTVTSATFADTRLVFTESGADSRTIYVKDGRVLMETGDGEVMLYSKKARKMTMIDHNRRGYFVMDPERMASQSAAMSGQMQQQAQQMQKDMAPMMKQMQQQFEQMLQNPNIPEAQKQMLRQQMEAMGGSGGAMTKAPASAMPQREPLSVRATGKSRKIAGISCKMHVVSRGTRPTQEVCVASREDAGIPRADYETMRAMFALMREVADKSMAAMGRNGSSTPFADLNGLPVQTTDLDDGGVSTLEAISTKKLQDQRFALPAGYQEYNPFQR